MLKDFINRLQSKGRYTFTKTEVLEGLGVSDKAALAQLRRQIDNGRIVSPQRGFYVIVPVEYLSAGSPPASWYIDDLAKFLKTPYYVGLLSASSLHGASHHQPQIFQVVLPGQKRQISIGNDEIHFYSWKHLNEAKTKQIKTPAGYIRVSTPESTSLDLVRFMNACGGPGNVITVISELAENLELQRLEEVISYEPSPVLQRLGFLLDRTGFSTAASSIETELGNRTYRKIPLSPGSDISSGEYSMKWKVIAEPGLESEA